MGNYRNIALSFWTDSKVDDEFTPEDKYFYLYLLTNPHTNICGCFEISMKQMVRETGYNEDTVKRLIHRLVNTHRVIEYNSATKEILIYNWHKYNWSTSDKFMKAVDSVARYIKCDEFRDYIFRKADNTEAETDNRIQITETDTDTDVCIPYGYPMDTLSETKKKRFVPPTLDEVKDYIYEKGYKVDAEYWFNYYTSNGWKVGRNKMVDWKACIAQWNSRELKNRPQSSHSVVDEWLNA